MARGGKTPTPTVSAKPGTFVAATPVTYPDGLVLKVTSIKQSLEAGQGPGVFPGRPHTAIALTFENNTKQPITLNEVVVTTTYGSPKLVASPVYNDPAATDFSGDVEPGKTVSAVYVFSIPTNKLGSVVTTVDFDSTHVSATFSGSAA